MITIYSIINLLMSVPLFFFGVGAMFWAGGFLQFYGITVLIYSLGSCAFLLLAVAEPNKKYVLIERAIIIILTLFAWICFLILGGFENWWAFAAAATLIYLAKWFTVTQVFNLRTRLSRQQKAPIEI